MSQHNNEIYSIDNTHTFINRLLAVTFLPNNTELPFEQCQVDHIDGDKLNNDLSNLEIVTPRENKARAYSTGLRYDNHPTTLICSITWKTHSFYSQSKAAEFLNTTSNILSYHISKKNNTNIPYKGYYLHSVVQDKKGTLYSNIDDK